MVPFQKWWKRAYGNFLMVPSVERGWRGQIRDKKWAETWILDSDYSTRICQIWDQGSRFHALCTCVCVCVRITLVYNPLYKQCMQLDLCRYHTRLDVWPYLTHPYIYIYIYIYIYVYICTYISTCVQGIIARRYTACSWKDETRNCRRNGKQNLDGHRTSLFTRCILKETWTWKETWTLTIEDFDFYSDDHFDGQSSGLCSSSGLF